MSVNFSIRRQDHNNCAQIYNSFKFKNALTERNAIPISDFGREVFLFEQVIPKYIIHFLPNDKMYLNPFSLRRSILSSLIFWWSFSLIATFSFWMLFQYVNPRNLEIFEGWIGLQRIMPAGVFLGILFSIVNFFPYKEFFHDIYVNKTGECHYQISGENSSECEFKFFTIIKNTNSNKIYQNVDKEKYKENQKTAFQRYSSENLALRQKLIESNPSIASEFERKEERVKKAKKYGIWGLFFLIFGFLIVILISILISKEENSIEKIWILVGIIPFIFGGLLIFTFSRIIFSNLAEI